MALFPLLRGDLRILDVLFSGVEVFLEEGPDGTNNYTFGDGGGKQEPRGLPSIQKLVVQDATIIYRGPEDRVTRYKITTGRLWNIPGQPERIEAEGVARGIPYTIVFEADSPAELSGPQNPWSCKVNSAGHRWPFVSTPSARLRSPCRPHPGPGIWKGTAPGRTISVLFSVAHWGGTLQTQRC